MDILYSAVSWNKWHELLQKGGSTTLLLSPLIGRAPQVCTRPLDSLVSHSCGTHNNTLWPIWNVLAPGFSSDIWTLVHHAAIVFLKSFSCHLPRRQCSQLDRLHQFSPGGHFYVHYDFQSKCRRGSEAKQ
ncbi:hypothetical protein TNCV_3174371 [Trichonephila clavipes]|nr:hypothetical protein TNCV_3174371 [Trichonephila clavipes]